MSGNSKKLRRAFGEALRQVRKAKGLTQEDFALSSGRTYISSLERGMKSPTIEKVEGLAETLKVHPLTLLFLAFEQVTRDEGSDRLLSRVSAELKQFKMREKD